MYEYTREQEYEEDMLGYNPEMLDEISALDEIFFGSDYKHQHLTEQEIEIQESRFHALIADTKK